MQSTDEFNSLNSASMISSQNDGKSHDLHFRIKRILILILISMSDMLVFFQRACPTVVANEIAATYGVGVSKLGIFSSMFYYPYSIFQVFSGSFSDVMEPAFLIGTSSMISSLGAIICGLSNTLFVGCIGRLLVGLGSAAVYCPCNRIIMNWFPLAYYGRVLGVFIFIAGFGSMFAQTPLTLLCDAIGWKWCFYIIAIATFVVGFTILVFVRGNPISKGYLAVNESLMADFGKFTFHQKMRQLFQNLKCVVANRTFWCLAISVFFSNGAFFNITGIWGGPYLQDILKYSPIKSGNALLSLSIGSSVGSLLLPHLASLFKFKKWFIVIGSFIAALSTIPFIVCPLKLNFIVVVVLLTTFSVTTFGLATVLYPMLTEHFHPAAGSTATGCINCFAFISLIIFMPLTGLVLDHFGKEEVSPDTYIYKPDGYKYGLWVFNLISLVIATICNILAKDPKSIAPIIDYQSLGNY